MPTPVAPFPINAPLIAAVVIAYANRQMIADAVMPRVPVGKAEFKYLVQNMADQFTVPDTRWAARRPNQVESVGDMPTASVADYGPDEIVPVEDVRNAPEGVDPWRWPPSSS